MRCNYCGWENPDGNQRCEKCNAPLISGASGLLNERKEITIGRKQDNDVVLDDPTVGQCHAKIIRHDDGHFSIVDLASTNGTFMNGNRIPSEIEVIINYKDVIRIGNTTLNIEEILLKAGLNGISKRSPTFPPPDNAMCYCQEPPNRVNPEDHHERRQQVGWLRVEYKLYEGRNTIGRDASCDISIHDSIASMNHATILFRNGKFAIKDDMSSHGTFVNGEDIDLDAVYLKDGDVITIGETILRFCSYVEDDSKKLTIQ